MTDPMMSRHALMLKASDADPLREMIGFACEWPMALEISGLTAAGCGEKSAERLMQRNRHCDRGWQSRAGTVALRLPRVRRLSCFLGVSTRSIEDPVKAFGLGGVSGLGSLQAAIGCGQEPCQAEPEAHAARRLRYRGVA